MNTNWTTKDVAAWMLSEIEEHGELSQNNAYYLINKQFGSIFTTVTTSGSPSIKAGVLTAFKKMTQETVVWERRDKNGVNASFTMRLAETKIKFYKIK